MTMTVRFGTDGIRGRADDEITTDLAYRLGFAVASVFSAPVFVGYDTRESSPPLAAAVMAGLRDNGASAVNLGYFTTPGVAVIARQRNGVGVVVSASHNPYFDNGLKVLIIDPAYLCLDLGDDAGNLFTVGKKLRELTDIGHATGCTIIIIHHNKKSINDPFAIPELESIAWSGFQEWARQWLLIGRRELYNAERAGSHRLWLNVGGSAGHRTAGLSISRKAPARTKAAAPVKSASQSHRQPSPRTSNSVRRRKSR